MSKTEFDDITFDLPKNQSNVIKVIGVGGGGSNAINHMFQQGIKGVDFVICNTDAQALENSTVPIKIQLGVGLTEGLGAGANPEVGEKAAIESEVDIKQMLDVNTKMVFITAGMGGGTGTGAAPVIAKMARELNILTVGIVTIPFEFEGKMRNEQAQKGVERLRSQVDSLIVINNNKLREVYGNLGFKAGFSKADEVLATAARGIAEVITHHYTQNIDLRDAKTVLSNSGTAIMGSSVSSGTNRAHEAISKALDSPLLNDNKIVGAKNVLLLIVSGGDEITIDEIGEINDHIQAEAGNSANIIMGVGEDETIGDAISVTIIATGFNAEQQNEIVNIESKKIIHTLEDEQKSEHQLLATDKPEVAIETVQEETVAETEKIVHTLSFDEESSEAPIVSKENTTERTILDELITTTEVLRNIDVVYEEVLADVSESDFQIIDTTVAPDMEEVAVETTLPETLSFDMPAQTIENEVEKNTEVDEEAPLLFDLNDDVAAIEVNEPVEIIPVTEVVMSGEEKRYSLDDYMGLEDDLKSASPVIAKKEEEVEEEMVLETRTLTENEDEDQKSPEEENDPINSPINELLVERAEERKRKMKAFNYKFHSNQSHIEDIEKQPAYKRMGISLDETPDKEGNLSRTTLSTDDNDDIQLRPNNNSFLHDNVD